LAALVLDRARSLEATRAKEIAQDQASGRNAVVEQGFLQTTATEGAGELAGSGCFSRPRR
jgi:hypothetical protein